VILNQVINALFYFWSHRSNTDQFE
jgi:hypothetical protein